MSTAGRRTTVAGALGLVVWTGCADKAPEPKWPEPPPPTLAEPIGQEAAVTGAPEPAPAPRDPNSPDGADDGAAPTQAESVPAPAPNDPEDGAVRIDR